MRPAASREQHRLCKQDQRAGGGERERDLLRERGPQEQEQEPEPEPEPEPQEQDLQQPQLRLRDPIRPETSRWVSCHSVPGFYTCLTSVTNVETDVYSSHDRHRHQAALKRNIELPLSSTIVDSFEITPPVVFFAVGGPGRAVWEKAGQLAVPGPGGGGGGLRRAGSQGSFAPKSSIGEREREHLFLFLPSREPTWNTHSCS